MSALAMFILNNPLLGGIFWTQARADKLKATSYGWLAPIIKVIDDLFWPVLIIVAAAGAIYIIILAVNLARAESADKATEAKKRLINVVIAIVSVIVLVVLLSFFIANLDTIINWFGGKSADSINLPSDITIEGK